MFVACFKKTRKLQWGGSRNLYTVSRRTPTSLWKLRPGSFRKRGLGPSSLAAVAAVITVCARVDLLSFRRLSALHWDMHSTTHIQRYTRRCEAPRQLRAFKICFQALQPDKETDGHPGRQPVCSLGCPLDNLLYLLWARSSTATKILESDGWCDVRPKPLAAVACLSVNSFQGAGNSLIAINMPGLLGMIAQTMLTSHQPPQDPTPS